MRLENLFSKSCISMMNIVFIVIAKPELKSPFESANIHFETKLVRLGENVSFTCPFKNFDRLEWFKGIEGYIDQNTTIEIWNASPADEGNKFTSIFHTKKQ